MQDTEQVSFCVEDTVSHKDDTYKVGVIDRCFGYIPAQPAPQHGKNIECGDGISRQDFNQFMRTGIPIRGTVLVSWQTQHMTELILETQLQLLDRAFYVGDVVKRAVDEHMSGTVIGTRITCTLFPAPMFNSGRIPQHIVEDFSIRNVPAHELVDVHEFLEDTIVIYGDWVGKIENVYDEVAIKLSNNSVVVVEDANELELEHDGPASNRHFVGDKVKTKKGNLRRGRWIYGAFDPNVRPEGMVVETRAIEVDVEWWGKSLVASDAALHRRNRPPETLGRDELESSLFHKFDATDAVNTVQPIHADGIDRSYHVEGAAVGDRVRFKDISAAAIKYDGTEVLSDGCLQGKVARIARTETLGYDLNVFLIMQTHSQVTVQWQDLTVTEQASSSLVPGPDGEDDEAWPGEIIVFKETEAQQSAKVGVVQTVKSKDRVASVRWFENPSVQFFGSRLVRLLSSGQLCDRVDDITLYDLRSTPALTRRRSDFVLLHSNAVQPPLDITGPSWFGEVIDLDLDGRLTVRLGAANPITDVKVAYENVDLAYVYDVSGPPMIVPANNELRFNEPLGSESDSDSDSFRDMWIEYEDANGEPVPDDEEDWSTEYESMPDLIETGNLGASETKPASPSLPNEESVESVHDIRNDVPAIHSSRSRSKSPARAPSPFCILDSPPPSNHHYLQQNLEATSLILLRRITKEHEILQTSLPPEIFVRTWDSRLDLLRVLLIGPKDTPYEYAPFVIDIHLGPSYPHAPPSAFFHSWTNGQGSINPNLYEDGKICLSLLGTWHAGEQNESWNPAKSTLLQVLVSIVGLVLVKEPYYNEAGYDVHPSTPETRFRSALYTERVYFGARDFISHALTNKLMPFNEDLEYLYLSRDLDAPMLLDKALQAAKQIVERSSNADGENERDGLRTVSLGAVVRLKRHIENFETILKVSTRTDSNVGANDP